MYVLTLFIVEILIDILLFKGKKHSSYFTFISDFIQNNILNSFLIC